MTTPTPTKSRQFAQQEPFWDIRAAATYLGISPKTVEKMRNCGDFPAAIVIGRSVRWEPSDVQAWAASKKEPVAA